MMFQTARFTRDVTLLRRTLRPYRFALTGLVAVMAGVGVTTAGLNYLIKWMMDELIIRLRLNLVPWFCLVVAGIYGVRSVLMYLSTYTSRWIGARAVDRIRREVFAHVIRQPMRYFQKYPPGHLSARLVHDAEVLEQGMTNALTDLFLESFKALGVIGYILWLNWKMTLLSTAVIPLMVFPVLYFGRRLRESTDRWHEALARLSHYLLNAVRGIRTVQAYRGEPREIIRFGTYSGETLASRREVIRWQALHAPFVEIALGIGMLVLIVLGSYEIRSGAMTPGGFTSFVAGLFLIYTPIRKLSRANALLQETATAAERLEGLRRRDERLPEPAAPRPCPVIREGLFFHHVWFAYIPDLWVLQDIHLRIPRGTVTAFVGPSGAGKSTLVQLVPRYFDAVRGRVTLDDVDVREIALQDLRGAVGWVPQEVFVFPGSIRHNIAYGAPEAGEREIERAAMRAHAHEFILRLPRGYDTLIGEGGRALSGGQLQRIALARALLMNPQILILDEATSALDGESELHIQEALAELRGQCTILIIAHRWSTVRLADLIVVLHEGRVLDFGTHDELVDRCPLYRRLWRLQTQTRAPSLSR